MKIFDEKSLFKVTATSDKLKIEVKISDLAWIIKHSPNNCDSLRIRRGRREEFSNYIASVLTNCSDLETGDTPLMKMFEGIFEKMFKDEETFIASKEDEE